MTNFLLSPQSATGENFFYPLCSIRFYRPPGLPGPPPPGMPPPPGPLLLPMVVTTLFDVKLPTCEPPDHVPPPYHPFHASVLSLSEPPEERV